MEFAIDSACAFSPSVATCPLSVTTPLSRSSPGETSSEAPQRGTRSLAEETIAARCVVRGAYQEAGLIESFVDASGNIGRTGGGMGSIPSGAKALARVPKKESLRVDWSV
jgi:hypothetical protein